MKYLQVQNKALIKNGVILFVIVICSYCMMIVSGESMGISLYTAFILSITFILLRAMFHSLSQRMTPDLVPVFTPNATALIHGYLSIRESAIKSGSESPEYAAQLMKAFGDGVVKAAWKGDLFDEVDKCCIQLDPQYKNNKNLNFIKEK